MPTAARAGGSCGPSTRAGGFVYWSALPAPVPGQFSGLFPAVNAGVRQAAREFRGRVSLIDANAFFTPGNRYRDYMTDQVMAWSSTNRTASTSHLRRRGRHPARHQPDARRPRHPLRGRRA